MLYFIAVWILLLVACCIIGTALLHRLNANQFERIGDRCIAAIWLGIVVKAIVLLALSLLLPLSPWVGIGTVLGLCAPSLWLHAVRIQLGTIRRKLSWRLLMGFLVLALAIAAFTARPVTWIDTGLYHYSVIRWLSQFGTVPGVALLFQNFGFTSSWFAFAAPLNAELFDGRVSSVTNGFAFLVAAVHFGIGLSHSLKRQARPSDWFILCFLGVVLPAIVGYSLLAVILVSPSPDIPVILLVGVVAWALLVICQSSPGSDSEAKHNRFSNQAVPLILTIGAVTFKLSAIPLLLSTSLFCIWGRKDWLPRVVGSGALIALLVFPMLMASLITSGCPLFPSSAFCLDLPWSPATQELARVAKDTHGWVSWYGSPPSGVHPWLWAIWYWFNFDQLASQNRITTLLIVVALICAIYIVRTTLKNRPRWGQFWMVTSGTIGVAFFMLTAPFFKFMFPYLILFWATASAVWLEKQFGQTFPLLDNKLFAWYCSSKLHRTVSAFFMSLVLLSSLGLGHVQSRLLLPPRLKEVPVVKKQVNDITYFSPDPPRELCWAIELPCAFEIEPEVRLRDPERGLGGGFVREGRR